MVIFFLCNYTDHKLNQYFPECGQLGTINLYGPVYDQPTITFLLWQILWQNMINLFLYGGKPASFLFFSTFKNFCLNRETRDDQKVVDSILTNAKIFAQMA